MVLQDKYKRANSSRYRATHGGIQSNRQKARNQENLNQTNEFPDLQPKGPPPTGKENTTTAPVLEADGPERPSSTHQNFSRRQLSSNVDRYLEPEPEPDQEPEPEIDLSNFLEKQKNRLRNESDRNENCHDQSSTTTREPKENQEDVDEAFNHLYKNSINPSNGFSNASKKPAKVFFQDPNQLGLDELDKERKKADAARELIARFSGQTRLATTTKKPPNYLKKPSQTARSGQSGEKNGNQSSDHVNSQSIAADLVGPLDDEEFLDEVLNDSSGTYGKFRRN